MRFRLLTALILSSFFATGQETTKITIWNNYAKWTSYHTIGRPEATITFTKNEKGDYVATHYYSDKRKKRIKPITIENDKVKIFENWLSTGKKEFKLSEIHIDSSTLYERIKQSSELNFPVKNVTIKIDSFKFCNNYDDKRKRFVLIEKQDLREEFTFFNSLGQKIILIDTFHIVNQILLHNLFKNKLPEEFPLSEDFKDDIMFHFIIQYLKMIECEDYFYKEYLEKNPGKSAQEKRMRTGWNFKEYVVNKKGIKE